MFNEKYKLKTQNHMIKAAAMREKVTKDLEQQLNMKNIFKKRRRKVFPRR